MKRFFLGPKGGLRAAWFLIGVFGIAALAIFWR